MEDPSGRLPVSCTVFTVENEMTGPNGIEASWVFASHALRYGAGCAIHLSKLDPKGLVRPSGVVASGPTSFGQIYSKLNEILRRGGQFRNGAIVLHLDLLHPDALEFITTPRAQLPWVKRCINITTYWWKKCTFKKELLQAIKAGDVWLNKVRRDEHGNRIRGNVCLEVYLPSRGTCLLSHVNLGACEPEEIPIAFIQGMTELCELHGKTGVGDAGHYLKPENDRQVGLGMLGLANLLKREGVTYNEFAQGLEDVIANNQKETKAYQLASQLALGIGEASVIARKNNMVRAFAIAPTASCSYRSKDKEGYTCTPEIAPPIARTVDRDSGSLGVETYNYGEVEIASECGFEDYTRVANGIMTLIQNTGLAHGYSYNSWSDCVTYDEEFIKQWLDSPQTSLYYSLQVMGNVQDKSDAYAALEDADVEDYLDQILTNEPQCDCAE
jgi:hypothetical protein